MLRIIFSAILVILILFLSSCDPKAYPITQMDIIGKYKANEGNSILMINKDWTFNQEIYINEQLEVNSGKWEVLSPDGENNIRLSFSKFILHMSSDSTLDSTLRNPKEFRTYAEKNKTNNSEFYISICYTSFCFIKDV